MRQKIGKKCQSDFQTMCRKFQLKIFGDFSFLGFGGFGQPRIVIFGDFIDLFGLSLCMESGIDFLLLGLCIPESALQNLQGSSDT